MLAAVVREAARRFGEQVALASDTEQVTYAELDARSDQVAAGMRARGVREGDVVALTVPSSPAYVVAYAAAAKLGAITAGVNPRLTDHERARVLDVAQPALVVDDVESLRKAGTVEALPPDPQRPVAIVFTSGTTGDPRGAVFRERQLEAIARIDTGGEDWGGGGPMLASTELAHIGFMTKLPWHLKAGARIHMLSRWRARDALRIVAEQRLSSVGGIAAQIALMLREPDFDSYDFSAVKLVIAGGAPSPPALVREARERFGAAYSIRYSSTESGGLGTLTAPDADDDEALHSVGRPRPGVDLEIRDGSGRRAETGEVGEVCLRSPAVMSEYWRDPDATAQVLKQGWLHTGDHGFVDERGLLRLVGRGKEMYIRGGYNVYPAEVEAVLAAHPGVERVAVVPRPDPVMGEIGVAVVVARGEPPTLDDLRRHAQKRLAAYKLPEAIRVVDDLPYNATHKLDRRALIEREAKEATR